MAAYCFPADFGTPICKTFTMTYWPHFNVDSAVNCESTSHHTHHKLIQIQFNMNLTQVRCCLVNIANPGSAQVNPELNVDEA